MDENIVPNDVLRADQLHRVDNPKTFFPCLLHPKKHGEQELAHAPGNGDSSAPQGRRNLDWEWKTRIGTAQSRSSPPTIQKGSYYGQYRETIDEKSTNTMSNQNPNRLTSLSAEELTDDIADVHMDGPQSCLPPTHPNHRCSAAFLSPMVVGRLKKTSEIDNCSARSHL